MSEHSSSSGKQSLVEDLFCKDTDSFKCLAQIFISRSSIFRHPLYPFPPLTDPGLDDIIDYTEPSEELDNVGVQTYLKLCKTFKISPFKRVIRSLSEDTLNLKYYGLQEKQIEAIMKALSQNKFVLNITLQDNWLTPKFVEHLSDMLSANNTLKSLTLKECRIQPEGAKVLNSGVLDTKSLRELDLSYNSLDDIGLNNLREGLSDNKSIRILNLSNNNLGEGAADALSEILTSNNVLEDLDLSWNNFYSSTGNNILFNALIENSSITKLKLAWNGIATKDATKPIMKYLKVAEDLQYLDFSGNRLTGEAFNNVRNGIMKCIRLEYLKIGNNLLKADEALAIAKLINTLKKIKEIHMENTFVGKDFLPTLAQAETRNIKIVVEGVLGNYVLKPPDQISLLFKRAKFLGMKAKSKKAQIDFGKFVVSLPEEDVLPADFELALKKFKLKLDPDLVQAFITKFPAPKGKVSCIDMRKAFLRYYPDTYIPPSQQPKLEETELVEQEPPQLMTKELYAQISEEEECYEDEEEYDEA